MPRDKEEEETEMLNLCEDENEESSFKNISLELINDGAELEKEKSVVDVAEKDGLVKVLGPPKLEKTVGVFGGIGLVVGSIIGSGIFLSPSSVLEGTGSVGLSLVIWTLCGLIALFGALCYVELGTEIPLSGAEYSYFYDSLKFHVCGRVLAFLYSWTATLVIRPSAMAIIAMIFAEYLCKPFFGNSPVWVLKLVALACIGKLSTFSFYSCLFWTRSLII